ncbi:MAG: putative toxin-antitoxin system toxin component, PIN family [Kiritimatiellae bacterium]|nr:putative toxin-antitoxin system toxin component, PIN family [Kiritimatiellia bacterium]
MRVVLDANVVIAAFASRRLCESILELCLDSHNIILSEHLLHEIHKTLLKKVKLPPKRADQIVALLCGNSTLVKPIPLRIDSCRDPNDVKVLGVAMAAQADAIVTGDKDLLVLKKIQIDSNTHAQKVFVARW